MSNYFKIIIHNNNIPMMATPPSHMRSTCTLLRVYTRALLNFKLVANTATMVKKGADFCDRWMNMGHSHHQISVNRSLVLRLATCELYQETLLPLKKPFDLASESYSFPIDIFLVIF